MEANSSCRGVDSKQGQASKFKTNISKCSLEIEGIKEAAAKVRPGDKAIRTPQGP